AVPKGRRGPFINKELNRSITNKRLKANKEQFLGSDFLSVEKGGVELWRISARVGAWNDVDYGEFKEEIRKRVEPILAAERAKLAKRAERDAQKAAEAQPEGNAANPVQPVEVRTAQVESEQ